MNALPAVVVRDAVAAFRETKHRPAEAESFFRGYWQRFVYMHPQYASARGRFMAAAFKELSQ